MNLTEKAYKVREMVLRSVERSGTGHVATSFSCAEILTTLYFGGILRFDPKNPEWDKRDRFVLSKGHAATGYYCVLAMAGFIPGDVALNVGSSDSLVGVHLQPDIPGVEVTGGSLGNGLGIACGMALAARMNRENHLCFVLTGDAETQEGSIWEAALFAGHHKLNNLVWIIDRNRMGCADFTENSLRLEPLNDKIKAFGFNEATCNGNDADSVKKALKDVRRRTSSKPLCIIAETIKGYGLPDVENDLFAHHYLPKKEQIKTLIDLHIKPYLGLSEGGAGA